MPAATLYPHTELIKGVGGPWALEGGDLVGDLIGGFGIGNVDIPIWRGVDGVVDSGLPEVPGIPWGPFLDRFLFAVESCSSCHTTLFRASCYPRFSEVL